VRLLELLNARGIAVTRDATEAAIGRVEWPGRLDWRRMADGREMLLDAAHNPAGAAALAAYLRSQPGPPLPLVFAAMRDKDVAGMFRELLPTVASLTVTRATNPRSAHPNDLARIAREIAPALPVAVEPSVHGALDVAFTSIRGQEGREGQEGRGHEGHDRQEGKKRIVVAGSIFLLGDVLGQLGLHS
jgi:folylpolyglutamate synthase/dihydropteroate synthase